MPRALPKEKLVSVRDDEKSVKAVVNTKLAKDIYKAKMEKYKKKLLNCDDKYSQVYVTIQLIMKTVLIFTLRV